MATIISQKIRTNKCNKKFIFSHKEYIQFLRISEDFAENPFILRVIKEQIEKEFSSKNSIIIDKINKYELQLAQQQNKIKELQQVMEQNNENDFNVVNIQNLIENNKQLQQQKYQQLQQYLNQFKNKINSDLDNQFQENLDNLEQKEHHINELEQNYDKKISLIQQQIHILSSIDPSKHDQVDFQTIEQIQRDYSFIQYQINNIKQSIYQNSQQQDDNTHQSIQNNLSTINQEYQVFQGFFSTYKTEIDNRMKEVELNSRISVQKSSEFLRQNTDLNSVYQQQYKVLQESLDSLGQSEISQKNKELESQNKHIKQNLSNFQQQVNDKIQHLKNTIKSQQDNSNSDPELPAEFDDVPCEFNDIKRQLRPKDIQINKEAKQSDQEIATFGESDRNIQDLNWNQTKLDIIPNRDNVINHYSKKYSFEAPEISDCKQTFDYGNIKKNSIDDIKVNYDIPIYDSNKQYDYNKQLDLIDNLDKNDTEEEVVYQLDEDGHLLDENGNYILDDDGQMIKLNEQHIQYLRETNMIDENQ